MSDSLKVAVLQSHLYWEDATKNRQAFTQKIEALQEPVDIIILPEMFTTGFTMNATSVAETMDGETMTWMKQLSSKTKSAIMGSFVVSEQGNFYNRLVFMMPDGSHRTYDKRHTFTLAGEHKMYTAGTKKEVITYKGWKLCPQICYDLRFPVWSRNVENYDVLIYVANWPKPRINAWDALLKARAIENMSYCIGVNRVGEDGNGHEYPGHSAVYDALGEKIDTIENNIEQSAIITLYKDHLHKYRQKLNFLNDRDSFSLEV